MLCAKRYQSTIITTESIHVAATDYRIEKDLFLSGLGI